MDLTLRPVRVTDDAAFRAAHRSLWESDGFALGLRFDENAPISEFIDFHDRLARGVDVPDDLVASTFLIGVVDGEIVGRISIRHALNEFLRTEGGHIGYGVVPGHRQRGYASEMLRQSLIIARSLGLESALLICAEQNTGSRKVIEGCGGRLISTGVGQDGDAIRRYEIAL